MKFLIDEALSPLVANLIRTAGHDAIHVSEYGMTAAKDSEILQRAENEERIIVSADSDFGTLLALRQSKHPSFILFRGATRRPEQQAKLLLTNLVTLAKDLQSGCIVVFHERRIRVRPLPIFQREGI